MNSTTDIRSPNWGRIISFVVLLLIIGVIGMMFFRVMQGFLLPLFLAALIVVVFRPIHVFMLQRTNQRKRLAALITTALVALIVIVPISWAVILAVKQGAQLATRKWDVGEGLETLRKRLGWTMPYKQELERIDSLIWNVVPEMTAPENDLPLSVPNAATLADLQQLKNDTVALEKRMHVDHAMTEEPKPRMVAARQELVLMAESLDEAIQAATTMIGNAQVSTDAMDTYENAIRNVGIRFGSLRDDLLGGFPRSHLVRLANPTHKEIEQWQGALASYLSKKLWSLTGSIAVLGQILFGIAIMLISVYFFLIDGPDMIQAMMRLSPLEDAQEIELMTEFAKVSRAVVLATLLSAVAQGLLAGVGYFFAGLDSIVLLTVLTTMLAMVPFVGAAAVWLPISVYLIFVAEGQSTAGIGLGIYGLLVVSMADNLVKPYILHGQSNLHPLLALLSVLGGVQALGPIGILVGPMLVAFLQALLNILRREITTMSG